MSDEQKLQKLQAELQESWTRSFRSIVDGAFLCGPGSGRVYEPDAIDVEVTAAETAPGRPGGPPAAPAPAPGANPGPAPARATGGKLNRLPAPRRGRPCR